MDFAGALVLVTHDRYMLDRVSTIVLGLDGTGESALFADYSQWEQFRTELAVAREQNDAPVVAPKQQSSTSAQKKRLSYKEQREWEQMETLIHAAEERLGKIQHDLQDPVVTSDPRRLQETYAKLQPTQSEVDKLYERWAELKQNWRSRGRQTIRVQIIQRLDKGRIGMARTRAFVCSRLAAVFSSRVRDTSASSPTREGRCLQKSIPYTNRALRPHRR
jgi:ATPase subunit of ABC transporter with duplicated ATPase domains